MKKVYKSYRKKTDLLQKIIMNRLFLKNYLIEFTRRLNTRSFQDDQKIEELVFSDAEDVDM